MNWKDVFEVIGTFLKSILWTNVGYTLVVVGFGLLILWAWRRGQARSEQGGVGFWSWLFGLLYFGLEIITVIILIFAVLRGSVWLWEYSRDQYHAGANEMAQNGGFNVTSVPSNTNAVPTVANVPLPTATPGNQPVVTGYTYTVTDTSGATVRQACASTSTEVGVIPYGSTVTLSSLVDSNCVNGVCKRGIISAVDPLPAGFNPVGDCLHLAALTAK